MSTPMTFSPISPTLRIDTRESRVSVSSFASPRSTITWSPTSRRDLTEPLRMPFTITSSPSPRPPADGKRTCQVRNMCALA